jgi:hypothetical protein
MDLLTSNPFLKMAFVLWAVFWMAGYFAHKVSRPHPTDIQLPLIFRLPFGNPRSNGTLGNEGIYGQIFGYLNGIVWFLAAYGIINTRIAIAILSVGIVLLTFWLLWSWSKYTTLPKPKMHNVSSIEKSTEMSGKGSKKIISLLIHPERNWGIVSLIVSTAIIFAFLTLWIFLILSNRTQELLLNQSESSVLGFLTILIVGVLTLIGIVFAVFPIIYLLDVRFDAEGIRVLTLSGYRFVRWSSVEQIRVRSRDVIILDTREQSVSVPLLSFQSPQTIIVEIQECVLRNHLAGNKITS